MTRRRILCMGDSITRGALSSHGQGYRLELGQRFTAGGVDHEFFLAAVGGSRSNELLAWAKVATEAVRPDLVILHIGTNDAAYDGRGAGFEDRYAQLLVEILNGHPPAIILPTFIHYPTTAWMAAACGGGINDAIYRQAMPGVGPHGTRCLTPADMQSLPAAWLPDGIHPDDTGHAWMGRQYYRRLQSLWELPDIPPDPPMPSRRP